jgi:hypothetical protein
MLLAVYRLADEGAFVLVASVAAGVVGWLFMFVLEWLVYGLDVSARQALGRAGIARAVGRGFLLLIPFTLLAILAFLRLQWDAALPFACAGIMTAGSASGAELTEVGDRQAIHWVLPMLAAAAFSTGWIALCALLGTLAR